MALYLGIDVGGTNIKYALMDRDGSILEKGEMPTPMDGLEVYLETLVSVRELFPQAEALVMSAPGRIVAERGYFYTGGSLTYVHETDLAALLADRIGIPFTAENDAKCAALAELWKGSMRGVKNGVVMTLGTGVGGAVILDGKIHRGPSGAAGEFSWMASDITGRYTFPGIWGLRGGAGGLTRRYETCLCLEEGSVNGRIFFERLNAGDPDAAAALDEYAGGLVSGILTLQAVLDVDRFSIGGGISRQPALIAAVGRKLDEAWEELGAMMPMRRPEITACTFGNDANLIGALYHYLTQKDLV